MMKLFLLVISIVIAVFFAIAIFSYGTSQPLATPTKPDSSTKDATVIARWIGPGSARLAIGPQSFFWSEGQTRQITLSATHLYSVIADRPGNRYQKDSIGFFKGVQHIAMSIAGTHLVIVRPDEVLTQIKRQMVLIPGRRNNLSHSVKDTPSQSLPCIDSFYIGKYDITQQQWEMVMGYNPSYFKACADCPVESVSWVDVQRFISILNQYSDKHYRLPTEAEWAYAAYGSDQHLLFAGSDDIDSVAWYSANSKGVTHPVGQKKPNALGLYDMTGDVWQWCSDYSEQYPGRQLLNNYEGADRGLFRIVRGGSWLDCAADCHISRRDWIHPDTRDGMDGFRLVQDF